MGYNSILLGTGCRSETLLNVRVKDINFELEYILLAHMKTKRQVDVPLSSSLKNMLQEYIPIMGIQDDDLLKYNPLDILSKKNRKIKLERSK